MTWTTRQASCWNTSLFHLSHAEVAKRLLSMCHNGTLMVQQGHQQHGALNYPWLGSLSIFLLEQVAWLLDGVGPFLPAFMAPLLAFGSPKVDPMAAAWSSAPNGPRPWMALHHVAKVHWLFLVQLAFHGVAQVPSAGDPAWWMQCHPSSIGSPWLVGSSWFKAGCFKAWKAIEMIGPKDINKTIVLICVVPVWYID